MTARNWVIYALFLFPLLALAQPQPPANTNASPQTRALLAWLNQQHGKHILSGQAEPAPGGNIAADSTELEIERIQKLTGKTPAIRAFDLFQVTPIRTNQSKPLAVTERALAWSRTNGIVAVQWHWLAPNRKGMYGYATHDDEDEPLEYFDLTRALISGTPEHDQLTDAIDAAAAQLAFLRDAHVPVLWRPLPECSGSWFWWGAKGPEPLKKLWKLMFERMTSRHGLNNLIWVFNPAEPNALTDWYPGDDYVDVISLDRYAEIGEFPSFASDYEALHKFCDGRKLLALSEVGAIPDPSSLIKDKAAWSWFCAWSGRFILDGKINPTNHLVEVYHSPYVLNHDRAIVPKN